MLKSNDKCRSIDWDRPVNTNSSSVLLFRLVKDYGPREYNKSNKTLPSTQTSPLYPVSNVSQYFLSNEHLTCQHCNKACKTETELNRHKTLITTNTRYHPLVMTTIQQLPEQSNTFGRKLVIPSRQWPPI